MVKLPRAKILRYVVLPGFVLVMMATLVWWFTRDPLALPQARSLSDGSLLSLEGVSWGREHHQNVEFGSWLSKLVKLLPDSLEDRLGGPPKQANLKFTTPDSLLLFMFAREGAPDALANMRVLLWDDAGNEFEGGWLLNTWGLTQRERTLTWRFDAFPRRHPNLTAQVLVWQTQTKDYVPVAKFKFPNPAYKKDHPQWRPEPVPVSLAQDGLTVTLREFTAGNVPTKSIEALEVLSTNLTHLEFTVSQTNAKSLDWEYQSLRLADATGNEWNPYERIPLGTESEWSIRAPGALWREEDAWKIILDVVRRSGFAVADVLQLPPMAIPQQTDQTTSLNLTNEWFGTNMAISAVSTPEQLVLTVKPVPLFSGASLRAMAATVDGTPLQLVDVTRWSASERQFTFAVPPGAGQVAITLARAENRRFEFVARPKRLVAGKVIDSEGRR